MNSHQRRILERAYQAGAASVGNPSMPQKKQQVPIRTRPIRLGRALELHGWFWKILLAAATLSGVGVVSAWPRIGFEPYASLNPQNPFAQLFYLENKSYYPIEDVLPNCGAVDVNINRIHGTGFSVADLTGAKNRLSIGARTTVTCRIDLLFGRPQTYQDLAIAVWATYKVPIIGWKQCTAARFFGVPAVNGTYIWTYNGTDSCPN